MIQHTIVFCFILPSHLFFIANTLPHIKQMPTDRLTKVGPDDCDFIIAESTCITIIILNPKPIKYRHHEWKWKKKTIAQRSSVSAAVFRRRSAVFIPTIRLTNFAGGNSVLAKKSAVVLVKILVSKKKKKVLDWVVSLMQFLFAFFNPFEFSKWSFKVSCLSFSQYLFICSIIILNVKASKDFSSNNPYRVAQEKSPPEYIFMLLKKNLSRTVSRFR